MKDFADINIETVSEDRARSSGIPTLVVAL